jgi:hypothetical protein
MRLASDAKDTGIWRMTPVSREGRRYLEKDAGIWRKTPVWRLSFILKCGGPVARSNYKKHNRTLAWLEGLDTTRILRMYYAEMSIAEGYIDLYSSY